jgi:DNA repair protein RadC
MILLLDAQNRVMGCEELFRGTLAQTSVYPAKSSSWCSSATPQR